MSPRVSHRLVAEFAGTLFLVAGVVGSGIMAERLAAGNTAVALLANALATAGVLYAVILSFGPISGAHFNPVVTLEAASRRHLTADEALSRVLVQSAGALTGVAVAHAMFVLPLISMSQHVRTGGPQWFSEVVATFGLITIIRLSGDPVAIAVYILGAYWFTSSTSFANPAVTLARSFTDTFSGIRPADVPAFIAAQGAGCALASLFTRWLKPERAS